MSFITIATFKVAVRKPMKIFKGLSSNYDSTGFTLHLVVNPYKYPHSFNSKYDTIMVTELGEGVAVINQYSHTHA